MSNIYQDYVNPDDVWLCKKCHKGKPVRDYMKPRVGFYFYCKECRDEIKKKKQHEYYENRKEKRKEYYNDNAERLKEQQREYYDKNNEIIHGKGK